MELEDAADTFCRECGAVVRSDAFFNAFHLSICYECRQQDNLFSLIPKSKAMADYLLSATSLADVQYLERPNPLNHTYQPMKLYLLRDVEQAATRSHGSLANIEPERKRRHDQALERKEKGMIKRMRKTMAAVAVKTQMTQEPVRHSHTFPPEREVYDQESQTWTQSCVCGTTLSFEKF